jgi:hypothetical protein
MKLFITLEHLSRLLELSKLPLVGNPTVIYPSEKTFLLSVIWKFKVAEVAIVKGDDDIETFFIFTVPPQFTMSIKQYY